MKLITYVLASLGLFSLSANALEIGPFEANGTICCLAEAQDNAAYYGQLFLTPTIGNAKHVRATDLSFAITRTSGNATKFRVLIVEVSGDLTPPSVNGGGLTFAPTVVLWESQEIVLPPISSSTLVELELPRVKLETGRVYAFLVDAFVAFDGQPGLAEFESTADYQDGYFFFLPNPVGSTREENFGQTWIGFKAPGPDLNFSISFLPRAFGLTNQLDDK